VPAAVINRMLKITRMTNAGTTTLIVSGRIDAEQLPDLRQSVETEQASDVVLALNEVSLVDVEAVRFLLHCEIHGIRLAHCPAYVREWMACEKRPP
jgi:ABC-type transporter Mla MlaB component